MEFVRTMKLLQAIGQADELRPNDIPQGQKAQWLFTLEGEFAEMMGTTAPENCFPEDKELLLPYPYDDAYELYLAAMIDNANQETTLYANDMAMANSAIERARSYYIRQNRPERHGDWRLP